DVGCVGTDGALGTGEALEYHDAQPFSQDCSITVRVEGLRIPRWRECRRLAEAHEHEDVVERVTAAGDDDIGATGLELQRREVDGAQRTGAGGIDNAVGTAEVEPIGDPTPDDISQ